MEISQIKQRLTLKEVLHYYGLKPDKYLRLHCPFHDDKTPSLQVYYKTQSCHCFSTNCKTHGKSLDVIDFIMHKDNVTKHEAIMKAKEMIMGTTNIPAVALTKTAVLTKMFTYFKNAVHNSKPAKEYLERRGLDYKNLSIGFNTGQFHHGSRRDEAMIKSCVNVGLLSASGKKGRGGEIAYRPFAKNCISFPLKNRSGQIVSLYFRSITNDKDQRHFYLKERNGLYPNYPSPATKILVLTESIIDCASLMQSVKPTPHTAYLSLYGTNGFTSEHTESIKELNQLEEVIFFLDGDEAGKAAVTKHASQLRMIHEQLKISSVDVPENEDVNSLLVSHEPSVLEHLLSERQLLFSSEVESLDTQKDKTSDRKSHTSKLNSKNPQKLLYSSKIATYTVLGGLGKGFDNMKVTLQVENVKRKKSRGKLDLYEDKQIEKFSREVAEKLQVSLERIEEDLFELTDLLESYRERRASAGEKSKENAVAQNSLTTKDKKQLEEFAKQENLIQKINELLGKTGIVGEEHNRIFLFLIALSHKLPSPLHALIQGSSGSGKTRLLKQISDCMPEESMTKLTRLSDKVLYNYPEDYFTNRLLCLEDIDGLSEEAEFAFRELQSNGELNSAVSIKLENGNITQGEKKVKGPIASMACTTHGEIYEDNMSRCFLVAVDESLSQTKRVITYQDQKSAGIIKGEKEKEVKGFLRHFSRMLVPYEVINPFAGKITLPPEAHKIRRLNELFQGFIRIITMVNQFSRRQIETDNHSLRSHPTNVVGEKLVAEIEDVEIAIEILFESIVLKVDELDGSLRQFYENLKSFVEKKAKQQNKDRTDTNFSRFEVREATKLGKTQQHHYIHQLINLEYVQQYGFANRGYNYRISHWDNYTALRAKIKKNLLAQLEAIKGITRQVELTFDDTEIK